MRNQWSQPSRYFVGAILLVAFLLFLWWFRTAIEPLAYAAFIAYLASPIVHFIAQRTKLSRAAAVNLVYFSALAVMIAVPATLAPIFSDDLKLITADLQSRINEIRAASSQSIQFFGLTLNFKQLADVLAFSSQSVSPQPQEALSILETTSRGVLWIVVVLISVYYFMADWPRLRDWLIGLAPNSLHEDAYRLYTEISRVWTSFLLGQLTLMFEVGILFSIVWSALGVPGALLLGTLAGLFTLVPDIGPSVVALIAVVVALLEGSRWIPLSNIWFAALVLGSYILILNLNNIWARPRILGRSVQIHEGLVFVAIIVAVTVQGVLLAVTIVPLLATAGVILRYLRARLLGLPPFVGEEPLAPPPDTSTLRQAQDNASISADLKPAAPEVAESKPKRTPVRKKRPFK